MPEQDVKGSGKADIFRAVHATAPRAMDDHAYRPGVAAAASAPPLPTVHRSAPNGHASAQSEISRAPPECLQSGFDLFMRLVLGPSGPRIRCPLCGWSLRKNDLWSCACGNE